MKVLCLLGFITISSILLVTGGVYARYENQNFIVDNGYIKFRADKAKAARKYLPEWSDLDKRPLPQWYDRAKVGIFLHWGVFSVPSFGSEWFWINWKQHKTGYEEFMKKNYPPNFTYQDFAPMFTAEFFDPDQWADLFHKSGAKYIVLTSKHHEGYTLFPSKRSYSWNSVDVGPHRDLVGDLSIAVRNKGMKFGVYHSLFEWYNPIYVEDRASLYLSRNYVETKLWPDLKQLVNDYNPSVIWSDGDWEALDAYWNSTGFLAWLYNESPVKDEVVVNDRWGIGTACKHGDFYNCEDKYNPGKLQPHKWENAFTLDKSSWGYRRSMNIEDVLTMGELLKELVTTVSCGGNVLINVGPTKEGTIPAVFQERLLALGAWLRVNGEAIYGSTPFRAQNDSAAGDVWYTQSAPPAPAAVFAVALRWPRDGLLVLRDVVPYVTAQPASVQLLGAPGVLIEWKVTEDTATFKLPDKAAVDAEHAWVLKFTHK